VNVINSTPQHEQILLKEAPVCTVVSTASVNAGFYTFWFIFTAQKFDAVLNMHI